MEKPPLRTSNAANIPSETFIFREMTQREHILRHPNIYVGSMEKHTQDLWVFKKDEIVYRSISYVPGLYKIFDAILVDAVDNKLRDPSMDSLKVTIDPGENTVSVYHNRNGAPEEVDQEEKAYVPELILDGRNGYGGAKLTIIFSTECIIETADGCHLKKYKQAFTNNMEMESDPEITICKENENWTKVTFKPDLEKFEMTHLEEDIVALMRKRVLDMAWCLGKSVKVELDGKLVGTGIINSFEHYVDLHMKSAEKPRPVNAIELLVAFSEKKAEDRKTSIPDFEPGTFRDRADLLRNYKNLFNKELILFSRADIQRSIPSMVDGLKPCQRKILFCLFKKKLCEEINVGYFIACVYDHFPYDHGEPSLASTVVGMAQDFVGSNNINLLKPNGQFGTRNMGGKDHAKSRCIYTELNPVTRCLFHENDDKLVSCEDEDGRSIERNWYIPIIPLVLVNGSEATRAGWRSYIPSYNPREIIANMKHLLKGENTVKMDPWYRGFTGTIEKSEKEGEYTVNGTTTEIDGRTFHITELPIRTWTQDYKRFLESITEGAPNVKDPLIEEFRKYGNYADVDIQIRMKLDKKDLITQEGLHKKFKLTTTISTSNMHLFDAKGKIKKFDNPEQILEEFFPLRLEYYEKRKAYILANLEQLLLILDNKERFISGVLKGEIIVRYSKTTDLLMDLKKKGFTPMPRKVAGENDDNSEAEEDGYEYLLSLPIRTLTNKGFKKLQAEKGKKKEEFDSLKTRTPESLWLTDLEELEKKLDEIDSKEAEEKRERSRLTYNYKGTANGCATKAAEKPPQPSKNTKKTKNAEPDTSMEVGILKATPTNSLCKGKSVEPQVDDNSEVQEDGYEYLLSVPIRTLTFEGFLKLLADKARMEKEFDILKATPTESLWMADLDELEKKLDEIDDSKEAEEERKRSSQAGKKTANDFATKAAKKPPQTRKNTKKKTKNVEPKNDNTSMEVENVVEVTTVVLETDSENEVIDVDDNDDFEVVQQPAPEAGKKKGGRKPAAQNAKKAPAAKACAATKKRNVGTKRTLGEKLLTDMLQPAEGTGTSPEKKVRKMMESPFNKKSGSILGRAANKDKSPSQDLSSSSG